MCWVLCGQALALEQKEVLERQAAALDLKQLERAAGEYAPEVIWSDALDLDSGLRELADTGTRALRGVARKAAGSAAIVLSIVLLSSVAGAAAATGGKVIQAAPIVSVLAVSAVATADANALIGMGGAVIEQMEQFSKILLPAVTAAAAAAGTPAGAVARQAAAMLFSDVLISAINHLLLPLVYVYIAASTAYAAVGNEGLRRIAAMLKWAVTLVLTVLLLCFVGYLSVSGVIAGTADAVTIKAAKFTMSSAVPVVGGILSDAAETVLAGAGLLKNTVGVFGMLVVLGMCVVPFLQLGVHYLTYKITAALSATVAESRLAGLIDAIGGAFGLVLGMTGACALLLLIAVASAVMLVPA